MTLHLDPPQSSVVSHDRGPLLVTGGPGTGKSTALVERFARLIESGADPERVVLVVASRRARATGRAAAMGRLRRSLPQLRVVTVHSLAAQVLGSARAEAAYDRPPEILGAADQLTQVRELLAGEDATDWPTYGSMLGMRGFADQIRQLLLRAQEALLSPEEMSSRGERAGQAGWAELAGFYRRYLDILGARSQVDFAGLVAQAAAIESRGGVVGLHVLVDDYQEATFASEKLLLGLPWESLVVAGDPGSHVFSFQGTTDVPIRRFGRVAPGATEVALTTSHRGAASIQEAWTVAHGSEEHEAAAREVRRIHVVEGVPWADLAVVVRRHGTRLGGLLRALDDAGIPRTVPDRATSLLGEPAIVPLVLGLRWAARPAERDALIEPLLVSDLAGLSPAAARGIVRAARESGEAASAALDRADGLPEDQAAAVITLRAALEAAEASSDSVVDAFGALWRGLPLARRLVEAADRSAAGRRDLAGVMALSDAVAAAADGGSGDVASFLEMLEAGQDAPELLPVGAEAEGAVSVLTAHGAAGREFDTVVVIGAVEGDFPSLSRPEPMFDLASLGGPRSQAERNRLRLEDERRLFTMVATRARRRTLFVASDDRAAGGGNRSRFAAERGLDWAPAPGAAERGAAGTDVSTAGSLPLTVAEAAGLWRRRLSDPAEIPAERLAALLGLLALGGDPAGWWYQRSWTGSDRPLHEGIRTSFSRLEKLENCALQYVLSEELGLDDRAGYHAWVGHLVHRLIEDCEHGLIGRSLDALVQAAHDRWRPVEFPSFAISEAFRRLVTTVMLPAWFAEYGGAPARATETHFVFEYDGATVSGYIDRIGGIQGGGSVITDYKTGRPRDLSKPDRNLQLGIYYLAVSEAEELAEHRPVKGVELVFLRDGLKPRRDGTRIARAQLAILDRDRGEYEQAVRDRLSGLIGQVRDLLGSENYPPNPRADCMFCRFRPLCPLWPEGGEVLAATGPPTRGPR